MAFTLASIHIYPLKSGAPLALQSATVETRGLARDRRWMVIDADGNRDVVHARVVAAVRERLGVGAGAPG